MFNLAFKKKTKKQKKKNQQKTKNQILSAGWGVGVGVGESKPPYVMRLQRANLEPGVKAAGRQMRLTEGKAIPAFKPPVHTQSRWPPPEAESWLVSTSKSQVRPPARNVTEGGK